MDSELWNNYANDNDNYSIYRQDFSDEMDDLWMNALPVNI